MNVQICECGTYKVRIHCASVCIKCESVNIKLGLSEDHEILHVYRGESVAKTCQT